MVGEKGNRPVSKEVSKHRILRKSESQKEQESRPDVVAFDFLFG